MPSSTPSRRILVLGAGELGSAIIDALLAHPSYNASTTSLTLAIRAETLASLPTNDSSSSTSASDVDPRLQYLSTLRSSKNINLVAADLVTSSLSTLTALFTPYTTVIHAGAMTLPQGTQLKITHAVTQASCAEYIPWQWGVDYDAIGPEGGMGLFAEQYEVRAHLRSQTTTTWLIVSCGVFMSFLFEESWGVVVRDDSKPSESKDGGKKISAVTALGGWDHWLTVTTARDIARCNAELVLRDTKTRGVVFIAGDTMQYSDFAELVERVVGRKVRRECWTTEWLREQAEQAEQEEEKKLWKYRVVFSEGMGLSWKKEGTYNDMKGISMQGVENWMRENDLQ